MTVLLPPGAAFDPWRDCGADMVKARQDALDVPPISAGTHPYSVQLLPQGGAVLRGELGPNGELLTTLDFTKSLYQLQGTGTNGPSGSPGYSYPPSKALISILSGRVIVADLRIRFPILPAPKHHYESGYHALYCKGGQLLGWNLEIVNADHGVILGGSHSHLQGVTLKYELGRSVNNEGQHGHYGVCLQGDHNVIEDLDVQGLTFHDIDVQGSEWGVFKGIKGQKLRISFHATTEDEYDDYNLFTDINLGSGRPIAATGNTTNLPWTGDHATFHQVRYGSGTPVSPSFYPSWLHAEFITDAAPVPPPEEPVPMPTPKFVVGDTVKVVGGQNVRSEAKVSSTKLGTQADGALGLVMEGPVLDTATNVTFYRVNFVTAPDGWAGDDKLTKVTPPVQTTDDLIRTYFLNHGWSEAMITRVLNGA